MKMKLRVSTALLVCVAASLVPAAPAAAQSVPTTSVANAAFNVSGNLDTFPCPQGCTTSQEFSGFAEGAQYGRATVNDGTTTEPYQFVVNYHDAPITGKATYTEPGGLLCGVTDLDFALTTAPRHSRGAETSA